MGNSTGSNVVKYTKECQRDWLNPESKFSFWISMGVMAVMVGVLTFATTLIK